MSVISTAKSWIGELTEVGLGLIALGVVVEIIFGGETGGTIPFIGRVTDNLIRLISNLGGNGVVGLIAVGIILHLLGKRRAV